MKNKKATVREDYSKNGDAWSHFPHEHARSRAYRWGEDGIAGISDNLINYTFNVSSYEVSETGTLLIVARRCLRTR